MQTGGSCSKPCSRSMRVPTEAPQAEAGQIGTARSLIAHPRGRAGDQLRCTRRSRPVQAAPARCAFRSVRRQPSSPATTRHAATAGRAHFAARRRATMRPLRASRPRSEAGPAPPPSRTPHRATARAVGGLGRPLRRASPRKRTWSGDGFVQRNSPATTRHAASADRGLAFRPRQQRQLRVAFLSSRP
jgi:hypothetical protein